MEVPNTSNKKGIIVGIVVIVIIAIITILTTKKATPAPAVETPVTATTTAPAAILYKDGTYSAIGTYSSPGGDDKISVTLVLKDNVVTDATVKSVVADKISDKFQDMFIAGFKQYVVGKKISDIKVTKVSGSSLTPAGFNDALTQIKAQAKA